MTTVILADVAVIVALAVGAWAIETRIAAALRPTGRHRRP